VARSRIRSEIRKGVDDRFTRVPIPVGSPELHPTSSNHFDENHVMSAITGLAEFKVLITLQAAGPIRPRTKYQEHKLLRAEARITLPFVPYPGLYLTFSKPKRRGMARTMYLRIRSVEYSITEKRFECISDEILASPVFGEMYEVRGSARSEEHFIELQKTLRVFGFSVTDKADMMNKLNKWEDGSPHGEDSEPGCR
jgi:hypothetical protein